MSAHGRSSLLAKFRKQEKTPKRLLLEGTSGYNYSGNRAKQNDSSLRNRSVTSGSSSTYTSLSSPLLHSQDSDVTCIPDTPTSLVSIHVSRKAKRLTHHHQARAAKGPFSSDDDEELSSHSETPRTTKVVVAKPTMKSLGLGERKFRLISTGSEASDSETENNKVSDPVTEEHHVSPVFGSGSKSVRLQRDLLKKAGSSTKGKPSSKFKTHNLLPSKIHYPNKFSRLPSSSSSSESDTDATTLGSHSNHNGLSELETPPPTVRRKKKKRRRILSESQESNEGGDRDDDEDDDDDDDEMKKEDMRKLNEMFPKWTAAKIREMLAHCDWCLDVAASVIAGQDSDNNQSDQQQQQQDSPKEQIQKKKKRRRIKQSPVNEKSGEWLSKSKMTAYFPTIHKPSKDNPKTKKVKKGAKLSGDYAKTKKVERATKPSGEKPTEKKKKEEEQPVVRQKRPAQDVHSSDDETNSHSGDSDEEGVMKAGDDDDDEEMNQLVLSYFNDARDEELLSINQSSKIKVKKIVALRPFEDYNDLLNKMQNTKGLNLSLLWNCSELFESQQVMTSLMNKCGRIGDGIQAIISQQLPSKDAERDDGKVEGQITQQPLLLNNELQLKPYQLIGLNWLSLMHSQGVNGILADEMGLGKTVQTIAFLSHLKEQGDNGPHLIVVPSSTLENWVRELHTWCPALEVILYTGSLNERRALGENILAEYLACNVIISSYNMCISNVGDRSFFRKLGIHYAVFDEAHMLKNMQSQRYKFLMKIRAERKLLLTGTPLQNNLMELIALLSFVMPHMFVDCAADLQKMFSLTKLKSDNSLEQSTFERERITHAKQIMKPFVLRRVKSEVLKQLPKKSEHVVRCPMIKSQEEFYNKVKSVLSKDFRSSLGSGSKMHLTKLSGAMMQLRKAANHEMLMRNYYDDEKLRVMSKLMLNEPTHYDAEPGLIFEDMSVMTNYELHRLCHDYNILKPFRLSIELLISSGKFRVLDKMLPELKQKGSRVLMFSQFVMVLDVIEVYMKHHNHRYLRLDGQTPVCDRLTMIDKYNNEDDIFVFLLSTRAGGLGINLTSANHVILHDIGYNPYNDKQAEDRCHRVGQKRNVTVTKLISSNSIEEAMLQCAKNKLQLEEQMTANETSDGGVDNPTDIAILLKESLDI